MPCAAVGTGTALSTGGALGSDAVAAAARPLVARQCDGPVFVAKAATLPLCALKRGSAAGRPDPAAAAAPLANLRGSFHIAFDGMGAGMKRWPPGL
mmetsp:Transcript_114218/g.254901  ORF Transcript_114218/g.254901 Transcript_114218/m.254901 type:complete len:96 (-) Transcript_114218:50-337(-)